MREFREEVLRFFMRFIPKRRQGLTIHKHPQLKAGIFMRYIITFLLSLFSFFLLQYFEISNVFAIALVAIIILAAVMYPLLKVIFLETNIDKIEKFLLENKKNPNFYMIYALANELDDDVREITEDLLQKHKQKSRQALYKVIEALYFKNILMAKSEVEHISSQTYRLYYQALILLEEGKLSDANEVIDKLPTKWMKNALLAERERKLDHLQEAKDCAKQALLQTKGLQRYLLHKTYKREFGIE